MELLSLGESEGDEGTVAVARGNWPLLSLLDLSNNCIESAGAKALAKGRWPVL